jgi:fumarate reductase subunit D
MVYCSRCGTQNADTNTNCTNCGAPLYTVGQRYPGSDREHYRKVENECFGLPNGGMIAAIIFGIIIVLVGLSLLLGAYGISFVFWPFIIIIFGILILLGALYGRRHGRYSEPPPRAPT